MAAATARPRPAATARPHPADTVDTAADMVDTEVAMARPRLLPADTADTAAAMVDTEVCEEISVYMATGRGRVYRSICAPNGLSASVTQHDAFQFSARICVRRLLTVSLFLL
jgi:hypothetical protein